MQSSVGQYKLEIEMNRLSSLPTTHCDLYSPLGKMSDMINLLWIQELEDN